MRLGPWLSSGVKNGEICRLGDHGTGRHRSENEEISFQRI